MTTCLDIVRRAMRAMGVIRPGQEPSGHDGATGLERLQDIIDGLPLFLRGEWDDVFLTSTAAYDAEDGERIQTNGYAATITLPRTITVDGVERAPYDLSRVQIIGTGHAKAGLWVYAASKGGWFKADGLALSTESPFGDEDTPGLSALLAVSLVDEYGGEVSQVTVDQAIHQIKSFRARFYRDVQVMAAREYTRNAEMGYSSFYDESVS